MIVVAEAVFERLAIRYTVGMVVVRYAIMVPICLMAAWLFFQLVESRFLNSGKANLTTRPIGEAIKVAA